MLQYSMAVSRGARTIGFKDEYKGHHDNDGNLNAIADSSQWQVSLLRE
jgi:hypothetical protein